MSTETPEIRFDNPLMPLNLRRWPRRAGEKLRAWDNADQLLLAQLAETGHGRIMVFNDQHGALSLPLGERLLVSCGDSWLARRAISTNARDNDLVWEAERWCWPDQPLPADVDLVVMRVPKSLALFEYQLAGITRDLPAGVPVWVGGMDKHLPETLKQTLSRWLQAVNTGRGVRKARVFGGVTAGPGPSSGWPKTLRIEPQGWQLSVHAGVFGGARQDAGGALLMRHVPVDIAGHIADLGCGNGMVGLWAAQRNPQARVVFCDESYQAIRSARENAGRLLDEGRADFHLGNGLDRFDQRFEAILLNPPFHRGHAVDDAMARMLVRQSSRQLLPEGCLTLVGNRHLDYHRLLPRYFGQVEQLAADKRFVVFRASGSKEAK